MGSEERPRTEWAVDGTTGYGFLNEVNRLLIDPASEEAINGAYQSFTNRLIPFPDLVYQCKQLILRVSLSSELNVLSRQLDHICQQHRLTRDFTLESLNLALRELIACFPVYRTYIAETQVTVDEEDRKYIVFATEDAMRRNPAMSTSIFRSIASILLLEDPPGLSDDQQTERRRFVMRFQQLTGPVMAKGVEDTAFYRQFPLVSLNEVGGDPQVFGLDVKTFHAGIIQRAADWPNSLSATSTHDTKRSEDLRARLNVLSEIPNEWAASLQLWSAMNQRFVSIVDGMPAPDRAAEYLLYQTLVGAWPLTGLADAEEHELFSQRMQDYMEKALHEAKLRTSWINPNPGYDGAVRNFVRLVLRRTPDNEFISSIEAFVQNIGNAGLWNSLSQTVLKLTCPGVPDIYQGTELWNFSLVDPDNRRPVDYAVRRHLLASLPLNPGENRDGWLSQAVETLTDGRLKLFVTAVIARFRREHPDFFARAAYVPLEPAGKLRDHVVAFARCAEERVIVVAVSRFFMKLGCSRKIPVGKEIWGDLRVETAELPDGIYRDLLSGALMQTSGDREHAFSPGSALFASLPVAVLVRG
jgi:(1->4)-alpha-D-glucan 1-alpha-D-glucosylmutase